MDEEKKKGKGRTMRIVIVVITVIICIAVIDFLVYSNMINKFKGNDISKKSNTTNQKSNYSQEQEEKTTISEAKLEQYVERAYRDSGIGSKAEIDEIEKYEEYEKGKYIYIIYSHMRNYSTGEMMYYNTICWIDTTESVENPKMYTCGIGDISKLNQYIKEQKQKGIEYDYHLNDYKPLEEYKGTLYSTVSQYNFQDDTYLKVLAFKKWLDKDVNVAYYYETEKCTYSGDITKNTDGSVSVLLKLYNKELYDNCLTYHMSIEQAKIYSATVHLTKGEATK